MGWILVRPGVRILDSSIPLTTGKFRMTYVQSKIRSFGLLALRMTVESLPKTSFYPIIKVLILIEILDENMIGVYSSTKPEKLLFFE